jgi:hypothetical protein
VKLFEYATLEGLAQPGEVTVTVTGQSWVALLLAITVATDLDLWDVLDEDVDVLDSVLSDALSAIMAYSVGGGGVNQLSCGVFVPAFQLHNTIVATTLALTNLSYLNHYVYQVVAVNDSDVVLYRTRLHVGSYKLYLYYYKGSNGGKCRPVFEGVDVAEMAEIDTYAVVATYNNFFVWDFVAEEAGEANLYIRVTGKNVSSSGYYIVINGLGITPVWS